MPQDAAPPRRRSALRRSVSVRRWGSEDGATSPTANSPEAASPGSGGRGSPGSGGRASPVKLRRVASEDRQLLRSHSERLQSWGPPSADAPSDHPTVKRLGVRSQLSSSMLRSWDWVLGSLDAEPSAESAASRSSAETSLSAALELSDGRHTHGHSPLTWSTKEGRRLVWHIGEEIPSKHRMQLREELERRGWRVDYNLGAVTRAAGRGVVVLPDAVVATRGTRIIELEEQGVHVASQRQLVQLLQHKDGLQRKQAPAPAPASLRRSRSITGSPRAAGGLARSKSSALGTSPLARTRSVAAGRADVAPSSAPAGLTRRSRTVSAMPGIRLGGGLTAGTSTAEPGGWPNWVVEAAQTTPRGQLTPEEAEKRESLRQANEAKEAARGRQKVLREAVVGGERRRTAELLRAHPEDVEAPDEHGRTLFWLAAAAGQTEVLQELADNGARVDAAAEDGATALYAACHRGARDTVRNRLQTQLQTRLQTERL